MTRRRIHLLIWLLLPLFALRGLVPTGYMFDISGGSLSIVLCGGNGPLQAASPDPHAGHAGHEHDPEPRGGHEQHEKQGGSICPFALAGASALSPTFIPQTFAVDPASVNDVPRVASFQGLFGPSRAQQSRAPPFFS